MFIPNLINHYAQTWELPLGLETWHKDYCFSILCCPSFPSCPYYLFLMHDYFSYFLRGVYFAPIFVLVLL